LLEVEQEAGDGVEIAIAHTWIYKGQDVLGKFFGTKFADSPTQRSMSKGISKLEMAENLIKELRSIRPMWAPTERLYLSQDFNELIARCRTDGIGMHGLEVFSPLGELLEAAFPEEGQGDLTWAAAAR
jgi:hypothetical protein